MALSQVIKWLEIGVVWQSPTFPNHPPVPRHFSLNHSISQKGISSVDKGAGCIKQDRLYCTHQIFMSCVGCLGPPSEQLTRTEKPQRRTGAAWLVHFEKEREVTFRKDSVDLWPQAAGNCDVQSPFLGQEEINEPMECPHEQSQLRLLSVDKIN